MEPWSQREIDALAQPDKRRIWMVELAFASGTWRAAQSEVDLRDEDGRVWQSDGGAGEVQGMGSSLGRRPREVTLQLHRVVRGSGIYNRIVAAGAVGAEARVYIGWVDRRPRLIVQPKLRFAGVIAANPSIALGETDRVTLRLAAGTARANRLTAPYDCTPAVHRAYVGVDDPIYDRVSEQTQAPKAL